MQVQDQDKIIAKVTKLLATANGTAEGGEHERNTAMKMALNLLAKHNLSMADCETPTEGREATIIEHDLCPWLRVVANSVAKMYFSHFFSSRIHGKQRMKFNFIGLESNVATSISMTNWIIKSMRKEAAKARKTFGHGAAWETSFYNAAACRISERCIALRQEAEAASKPQATGTGMVLASLYDQEDKANSAYIKDVLGKILTTGKIRMSGGSLDGLAAGREFGSNVNLSNQLTGGAKKTAAALN